MHVYMLRMHPMHDFTRICVRKFTYTYIIWAHVCLTLPDSSQLLPLLLTAA